MASSAAQESTLKNAIFSLSRRPDPLFPALIQARQINGFSQLDFPSLLLSPERGRSLRSYERGALTKESPLFLELNRLISLMEGRGESLEEVRLAYERYIQEVCSIEGKPRWRLLKGEVRLITSLELQPVCLLLSRKMGRSVASLDREGRYVQTMPYGSTALFRVGEVVFQRPESTPYSAGVGQAVHAFLVLFRGTEPPPLLLVKLSNLFIHSGSGERRMTHLFQVSRVSLGEPLFELLKPENPSNILNRLLEETSIPSFTRGFLIHILSLPRESDSKKYQITYPLFGESKRDVQCVDYPEGFTPPFEGREVKCRSIRFLLDPLMSAPFDPSYRSRLSGLDVDLFLIGWVATLVDYHRSNLSLRENHLVEDQELQKLSLPLKIPSSMLPYIHQTLMRLQELFRSLDEVTHWKILENLLPPLYEVHHALVERYPGRPLEAEELLFSGSLTVDDPRLGIDPSRLNSPEFNDQLAAAEKIFSGPTLSPFAAFESWLPSLLRGQEAPRQRAIIERIIHSFKGLTDLTLAHLQLTGEELASLLESATALQKLTLRKNDLMAVGDLKALLTRLPKVSLVIEEERFTADELTDLIQFALDRRASLSFLIGEQSLPLSSVDAIFKEAMLHSSFELARALLPFGPNLKSPSLITAVIEKGGQEAFSHLIEWGLPLHFRIREDSLLHLVAGAGRSDLVEYLSKQPGFNLEERGQMGQTALHRAVLYGHTATAKLLMERGADPLLIDDDGRTALNLAVAPKSTFELVCLILDSQLSPQQRQQLLNTGDSNGRAPLHWAVRQGDSRIVQRLIEAGALVNQPNEYQFTPLHWAAQYGFPDNVRLLVEAGGALDLRNCNGKTPFDLAINWGRDRVVWQLLSYEQREGVTSSSSSNVPPSVLTSAAHPISSSLAELLAQEESFPQTEESCCHGFETAYALGNTIEQIFWLEKLSRFYIEKKSYLTATQILNQACVLAEKIPNHEGYLRLISSRLESVEGLFLEELGEMTPASYRHYIGPYRNELRRLRAELGRRLEEGEGVESLQSSFVEGYRSFFARVVQDALTLLGQETSDLERFSVVLWGEVASGDPSIYPQIAFSILTEDRSKESTLHSLAQLIALKMVSVGEQLADLNHPFSLDELSSSLTHFNTTPLSSFSKGVIAPENLARADIESLEALNRHRASWLAGGSPRWIGLYRSKVEGGLNSRGGLMKWLLRSAPMLRESCGQELMQRYLDCFRTSPHRRLGELATVDIDRELYQPLCGMIQALALYCAIPDSHPLQQLHALVQKGELSQEGGENIKNAIQMVWAIRLRTNLFYRSSTSFLYPPSKDDSFLSIYTLTSKLKGELSRVYQTLTPLYSQGKRFLKGDRTAFRSHSFYDLKRDHYEQRGSLSSQKEVEEARESLQKLREQNGTTPHSEVADALQKLGDAYHSLDRFDQAMRCYQEALTMSRSIYGSTPHVSLIDHLNRLGNLHDDLGQGEESMRCCQEALAMCEQLGNSEKRGRTLDNLSIAYVSLGRFDLAEGCCREALSIFEEIGESARFDLATTYSNLGNALRRANKIDEAVEAYKRSLEVFQQIDPTQPSRAIASVLNNLGDVYKDSRLFDEAADYFQRSLAMKRQLGGERSYSMAITLGNLGELEQERGELSEAIKLYQEALSISQEIYGDLPHPTVFTLFQKLGRVHLSKGELREAERYFEFALEKSRERYRLAYHPDVVAILVDLGDLSIASKDYEGAILHYRTALEMQKKIKRSSLEATILMGLGVAYRGLGEPKEAVTAYESVLLDPALPDATRAATLNNLGNAYSDLGETEKALQTLKRALKIQRQIYGETAPSMGTALSNLGNVYLDLARFDQAIDCFERSLNIHVTQFGTKSFSAAEALLDLGLAYERKGGLQEAADLYQRACDLLMEIGGVDYPDTKEAKRRLELVRGRLSLNGPASSSS